MVNPLRVLLALAVLALAGMLAGIIPIPVAWTMLVVVMLGLLIAGVVGAVRVSRQH